MSDETREYEIEAAFVAADAAKHGYTMRTLTARYTPRHEACAECAAMIPKLAGNLIPEQSTAIENLREVLRTALIPLAALVVSGECVNAPSALCEDVKQAIVYAHDEILRALAPALPPPEPPTKE